MDHMALPIAEALPRVVDSLLQSDLKGRIRVIAAGKLVTSARAAWALCVGADFVNTRARLHVRARLHPGAALPPNTCPTGRHDPQQAAAARAGGGGEIPAGRELRDNMNKEIDMIAHSCGCRHARELKREHVRIVQSANQSIALNMLYPYPIVGSRTAARQAASRSAAA